MYCSILNQTFKIVFGGREEGRAGPGEQKIHVKKVEYDERSNVTKG